MSGHNPFATHADIPIQGETVIEGKQNAPVQYVPSSYPDLRAATHPALHPMGTFPPNAMGPPQTLPPTAMRPPNTLPPTAMGSYRTLPPTAMDSPRTRPPGAFPSPRTFPPGSFQSVPPPSMPFHSHPRLDNWNPMPLDTPDLKDGAPSGSFHGFYSSKERYPVNQSQSWAPEMMDLVRSNTWNGRDNRPQGRSRGPQDVMNRYHLAGDRNQILEDDLNLKTGNAWKEYHAKHFSALAKAHLEDVDWRVPRTVYCKDPKYDSELPHKQREQTRQAKMTDGANLEHVLGEKAITQWADEHRGSAVPPEENVRKPGVPFDAVHPGYRRWDDMWERELTLRNLGEAMNGDLHYPMPKPVLFGEDYQNFHQGKYLKDDCPIA